MAGHDRETAWKPALPEIEGAGPPLSVPFTDALRTMSRWGSGAKDFVAVMEQSSRSADHGRPDEAT
jgi:hypothetical protein